MTQQWVPVQGVRPCPITDDAVAALRDLRASQRLVG